MTDQETYVLLNRIDNGYEPTEVEKKELSNIKSITWRNIEIVPQSIEYLSSLERLDLRSTKVSTLPESIGKLSNLEILYLHKTPISSLPDSIGNLKSLKRLDLSKTKISVLLDTDSIWNLSNLQILDLGYTQISDLSESVGKLSRLQNLFLGRTQISNLPHSILNLKENLQSLDLSKTKITELPKSIWNLSGLQVLDLGILQISKLLEGIGNLSNLKDLYLGGTQISSLPESIGNLKNLQRLDLSFTQLSSLPESIGELSNLRYLNLRNTKISKLPQKISALKGLEKLILNNNSLSELPEALLDLDLEFKNEEYTGQDKPGIYIGYLKLQKQPASLFSQPRDFISDYFKQPKKEINETKIIFLGSEGVGKTHTIKRILNDNHKISEILKETPGISIEYKIFHTEELSYRINFWDFGGQEIMHAMHRCFLTDRTGYVLVVSTRFGDVNKQARYWLKNIESFTKGAPVVIYVNVWSEGTYYRIDEYSLRRDYPNIIDVKYCSARDGDDTKFAEVVKSIQKMALANDSIAMSFPASWENVRQEIIALGKPDSRKYYISQQEFRDKCRENGIDNNDIQAWLLEWFNDLGECFSYKFDKENHTPDKDLKVLNPEWLTNAIYIIIREAGDLAVNGFISHEGIHNKLDHSDKGTMENVSYSEEECNYVLEVMRKFRLSYKVPGQSEEFIPTLLREEMPSDLQFDGSKKVISYEMKYEYLPENVIHNLMIHMYPYLDYQHCWRKGVIIDIRNIFRSGLLSVLDMSRDDEILRIEVYSNKKHEPWELLQDSNKKPKPWELLQEIRSALLDINSRMNLKAEDYIIIDPDNSVEKVSVEKLLKLKKRGEQYYQGDDENYEINKLLGDTFGKDQVRRIDKIEHAKEKSFDAGAISGRGPDDYFLQEMKAVLIQPNNELLFSPTKGNNLTCDKLCDYLISACAQIQSNPLYWNTKEDMRSTQVRDILRDRGIFVSDHTLYGHAEDSDNQGEVDLMIMKDTTDPLTIIEAMNIDSVNKEYIQRHLKKLLDDYNPTGLHELFLVAYVKKAKKNFQSFWEKYIDYITCTDAGDFGFKSKEEYETDQHFIKHAVAVYDCGGGKVFRVHHICMRAGD